MTEAPSHEHPRRPALKFNRQAAEQFGIDPDAPTVRETVRVDIASLPDPPGVSVPARTEGPGGARFRPAMAPTEDAILHAIAEEMDELAVRLERYGLAFPPSCRQQMIDTAMALLAGVGPGGAVPGR